MTILGKTEPLENFECVRYEPGNAVHEQMFEEYMSNTDVANNSSRKAIKAHLYDHTAGVMLWIVHKEFQRIDAVTSCVLYVEDGIRSAKTWHRLHIKDNVPNTVIDAFYEPETYRWCEENNIQRLWVTFNEDTPRVAGWAASRMGERRNANRPNAFTDAYGHSIRANWRPHKKLIYEMYTWQYVIYYAPDNQFFLQRKERPLNTDVEKIFRREFPNATQDWN